MSKLLTARWCIGLIVLLVSAGHAFGASSEDFEVYALGTFPPAPWLDAGQADGSGPDPSAVVALETGPFGSQTQAMSIFGAVAPAQGAYQVIPVRDRYMVMADVRVDRFARQSTAVSNDWAIAVGVFEVGGNPAYAPQGTVYASSLGQGWRLFASGGAVAADRDLGVPVSTGRWYRVFMELDVASAQVRSRIWDIALDQELVNRTEAIPGAIPASPAFDGLLVYEGELSPVSVSNLAVFDNVGSPEIFADGFESGDLSRWAP